MSMYAGVNGGARDPEILRQSADDRQQRIHDQIAAGRLAHEAHKARPSWWQRLLRRGK